MLVFNTCTTHSLQRILVGICRDLTGLTLALTSKISYMMLFEWMYLLCYKYNTYHYSFIVVVVLVGCCREFFCAIFLFVVIIHRVIALIKNRYPQFTPVLIRALELWYHDPNVTTPVLKLMMELMQNRSQRLHFGVSSPNGILLFRECSKVLLAYGKLMIILLYILNTVCTVQIFDKVILFQVRPFSI